VLAVSRAGYYAWRRTGLTRVWASAVTACPTAQGWLYLAVVLDLASRRVVGWAAGATVGQELTLAARRPALARRRGACCITPIAGCTIPARVLSAGWPRMAASPA
jgi:transposase InsO family protein